MCKISKVCLGVLVILLSANIVSGQTVVFNPTSIVTAVFDASTDHNVINLDGTSKLTSYQLDAVAMNSIGAVAFTTSLGKPTPINGVITVIVPLIASSITPDRLYTATITTIGPGGAAGPSLPSNPFGVATGTLTPPAAVTNLQIKKTT